MEEKCTCEIYQEDGDVGIFTPCGYCKKKEESTSQSSQPLSQKPMIVPIAP